MLIKNQIFPGFQLREKKKPTSYSHLNLLQRGEKRQDISNIFWIKKLSRKVFQVVLNNHTEAKASKSVIFQFLYQSPCRTSRLLQEHDEDTQPPALPGAAPHRVRDMAPLHARPQVPPPALLRPFPALPCSRRGNTWPRGLTFTDAWGGPSCRAAAVPGPFRSKRSSCGRPAPPQHAHLSQMAHTGWHLLLLPVQQQPARSWKAKAFSFPHSCKSRRSHLLYSSKARRISMYSSLALSYYAPYNFSFAARVASKSCLCRERAA